MHWEWVYLPASSYAIFSSCFLSTNQPHSACLNTGGLRISKKMQFRGLRTTRSWITSWHSKLEFVPNIRRGIYPFRSHKRILYQIPGRNLSARFFWLWGVIRPLNSWTWGTSRRAEIQQQFRKSVVQETSLCTFVLRYLPTCSVIITYIFQTAYSYHFISVYISDCMCTTTHLYWPLHRSHTYHALESLAIGGCWSYISMDRVPRSPKDESESGGLKYFQCWLSHASTRTQMQKKKLLCSVAKQAIPGAKKNIATFVN